MASAWEVSAGQIDATTARTFAPFMVAVPDVDYPYAARARRMTGHGVFDIWFDLKTGLATQVKILRSTGNPLLNEAAIKGLSRWRAKPGKLSHMQVPVSFALKSS